jgi:energy-coupling factor transporter ATP-binding protein EcfA2
MSGLCVNTDFEYDSNHTDSFGSSISSPHEEEIASNRNYVEANRNTNEYFLKKIIRKKEYPRRVITGLCPGRGKFIQIDSKLSCCCPTIGSKDKNKIFINFDENVISKVDNIYGTSGNCVVKIRRDPPYEDFILLTSENNALVELFYNEIISWIKGTNNTKFLLWKWAKGIIKNLLRGIGVAKDLMIATELETQYKKIKGMSDENTELEKKCEENLTKLNKKGKTILKLYLRLMISRIKQESHGCFSYEILTNMAFEKLKKNWEESYFVEKIFKTQEVFQENINIFDMQSKNTSDDGLSSVTNFRNSFIQQNLTVKSKQICSKINNVYQNLNSSLSKLQLLNKCAHTGNTKKIKKLDDSKKVEIVKHLQEMADLRHNIQAMSNEGEEFILVGDQSSGKSTLLSLLLGVNIAYSADGFATRCPVRYLLEPCSPDCGWKFEFEDPESRTFTIVNEDELKLRLSYHFETVIGSKIINKPVTIKIWSPTATSSMTLVDLPGLIGSGHDSNKETQHLQSVALVSEYVRRSNTVILYVTRFDVDIGSQNTNILEEVQKRPVDKVVYCLTHFDRYCVDTNVTPEDIYKLIKRASEDITLGREIFLLSLSKTVEELPSKEQLVYNQIEVLKNNYSQSLNTFKVNFNISSLRNLLRKRLHKNLVQVDSVVNHFISLQKSNIHKQWNLINEMENKPLINQWVLDKFLVSFSKIIVKILKGQFLPSVSLNISSFGETDAKFFETLPEEVFQANNYAIRDNVSIWPNCYLKIRESLTENEESSNKQISDDISDDEINLEIHSFDSKIDQSMKRDIMSHSLFTRTIEELQNRLWSVSLTPEYSSVIYSISSDPNINIDDPKSAVHSLMFHTVQEQLRMLDFFDYSMKRLEYIFFKIIRFGLFKFRNTSHEYKEAYILDQPEFQAVMEIEIHKYITTLSFQTKKEIISIFNEIMNSPIVISHAQKYKDILKSQFQWTDSQIHECLSDEIFTPRQIKTGESSEEIAELEEKRTNKIRNFITLHINIRLILIMENMHRCIDYHWRRMLDNSQESVIHSTSELNTGISFFEYLKDNVLEKFSLEKTSVVGDKLFKLYSGEENQCHLEEDISILKDAQNTLKKLSSSTETLQEVVAKSIELAGNKFL